MYVYPLNTIHRFVLWNNYTHIKVSFVIVLHLILNYTLNHTHTLNHSLYHVEQIDEIHKESNNKKVFNFLI